MHKAKAFFFVCLGILCIVGLGFAVGETAYAVARGFAETGSAALAQPEQEQDQGEFIGGQANVAVDNVVDGNRNTVYDALNGVTYVYDPNLANEYNKVTTGTTLRQMIPGSAGPRNTATARVSTITARCVLRMAIGL